MSPVNLHLFDRPAPPAKPATARRSLRPYQREAIDAVHRELQRVRSTAIVLHCGAGKTLTMAEWLREAMARDPGARGLWLANREFLLKDARARLIEQLGCAPHRIGIEKAEYKAGGEPIVVGSLQTLVGKRLAAWDRKAFKYIVYDECFPAGTMIDGRPIETIKIGDSAWSIDHDTGELCLRRVMRTFRKISHQMVEVVAAGRAIECTPNHPFFVKGKGYVSAENLGLGDLLCLQTRIPGAEKWQASEAVPGARVPIEALIGNHGAHESNSRIGEDEDPKSNEESFGSQEAEQDLKDHWPSPADSRRERNWPGPGGGENASGGNGEFRKWLVDAGNSQDWEGSAGAWATEPLQTRCRKSGPEVRDRGGRRKPQFAEQERTGPKKRGILVWARVDGISRIQPRSDRGITVYNLEVEGTHTYFADGILVHNCHHASSPGSLAVLKHFEDAKILGGTATLVRHDKVGAWNAWESIAYERGIDVGIEDGYFVPVVPIARFIDAIHLEGIDTVQSPLGGKDLALGALEKEIAAQASAIAKLSVAEMGDRPTIIYTPGVASAHAVADTLNEMKPGSAKAVDADTPDFVRDRTLAEFGKSIQWIVNCGIYLEGLDVPNCKGIVIARPTKSESLYIQMAGRGGRPEGWIGGLETRDARVEAIRRSGKPNFILLDITGHAGRHSLCSAATLAGKASKSEKEEAAQILKDNEGMTLGEALKEAQRREKSRIAVAAALAEIEARRATFDPFRRHNIPKELEGIAPKWHDDPPTEGQLAWCADQLVENVDKLTRGDIHLLITKAKEWEANGMATMRQRNILAQHNLPTDLPFKIAGELVFAVRLQKKRPPQVTVNRILAAGRA